jgi:hypothetical protein
LFTPIKNTFLSIYLKEKNSNLLPKVTNILKNISLIRYRVLGAIKPVRIKCFVHYDTNRKARAM